MDLWVWFVATGVLAGLFAGLLGIGGGGIMAPLLLLLFDLRGDLPEQAALGALATSTAAILFTAVPSATVHYAHGSVNWRLLLWISPAAALSSVLTAQFAQGAPPVLLVAGLAVFLCHGCRRVLQQRNAPEGRAQAAHPAKLAATGAIAGVIGTLTGTGGGIVVAPALVSLHMPLINAIGTSSGNTFFVALGGSLSYSGTGVDASALLAMAPPCVVFALVGARLANKMPRKTLSIVYAGLLIVLIAGLLRWLVVELSA